MIKNNIKKSEHESNQGGYNGKRRQEKIALALLFRPIYLKKVPKL